MDIRKLLDWFEPDELERCESCGERHGLKMAASGSFICFGCGHIRWAGGVTSVSAIQGRKRPKILEDLAPRRERRRLHHAKQHGVDLMYRSGDTHHLY
jgi:ribosomal protein L37AE/L43A